MLSLHSLPGEMETLAWYFSLLARNRRVTKSVGCHKRAKPGGEREEKGGWEGGERLRSRDAREDSQSHLVLIRQSGKQMSAVRQIGRGGGGGEGWSVDLLGRIYCLACPIGPPPVSSVQSTLTPFLPSQVDFSNSSLPEERKKARSGQQRRECLPLSSFLSLSVIPSNIPNPLLGAIFHHGIPCVYYPVQNTSH